jgi:hypothetical protein
VYPKQESNVPIFRRLPAQCHLTVHQRAVLTPPRFVEKLSSSKVDSGENLTLSVKAVGNPVPNLTWLKVIT